jgi:hypothetical protein
LAIVASKSGARQTTGIKLYRNCPESQTGAGIGEEVIPPQAMTGTGKRGIQ